MNTYELLGFGAAILLLIAFWPYLARPFKTQSLHEIPWRTLILQACAYVLWGLYGFRSSAPSIVLLAALALSIVFVIMSKKVQHDKHISQQ